MPLPTRVPCPECKEDTLHIWDKKALGWKCNGCKTVRHPIAKQTRLDELTMKELNRGRQPDRAREAASRERGRLKGRGHVKIPWSIKSSRNTESHNNVTHRRTGSDQAEADTGGGPLPVGVAGNHANECGQPRRYDGGRGEGSKQNVADGPTEKFASDKPNDKTTTAVVEEDLKIGETRIGDSKIDATGIHSRAASKPDDEGVN